MLCAMNCFESANIVICNTRLNNNSWSVSARLNCTPPAKKMNELSSKPER